MRSVFWLLPLSFLPSSPWPSFPQPLLFLPVPPAFLSWCSHAYVFSHWEAFLKHHSVGLSGSCNFICEPSSSFSGYLCHRAVGLRGVWSCLPSTLVVVGLSSLRWSGSRISSLPILCLLYGCSEVYFEFWTISPHLLSDGCLGNRDQLEFSAKAGETVIWYIGCLTYINEWHLHYLLSGV